MLQHMNLVLKDAEEFRKIQKRRGQGPNAPTVLEDEKRTLGLAIVRGQQVVGAVAESSPPPSAVGRPGASAMGNPTGTVRSAGRGTAAPPNMQGPAPGVGGPGPGGFGGFPAPGGAPGFGRGGGPPGESLIRFRFFPPPPPPTFGPLDLPAQPPPRK